MLKELKPLKDQSGLVTLTVQFQLLGQLKHYGLNPYEWNFHSIKWSCDKRTGAAEVKNRKDPNLRLKGQIERSPALLGRLHLWQWSDLCWDL